MSVKRYKLALPDSSQRIREARKKFKDMPKLRRIELMVEARILTAKQAERAKKKLSETPT